MKSIKTQKMLENSDNIDMLKIIYFSHLRWSPKLPIKPLSNQFHEETPNTRNPPKITHHRTLEIGENKEGLELIQTKLGNRSIGAAITHIRRWEGVLTSRANKQQGGA